MTSVEPPRRSRPREPAGAADSQAEMAAELRRQIAEHTQAQHQLLLLAAAIAGATVSFGAHHASSHSVVLALLAVLFVGLALATLRQDQEITILASHLLDAHALGEHALAQARWEHHRATQMQATDSRFVVSTAVTVGIYGVPVVGALGYTGATLAASPSTGAWMLLAVATLLGLVFVFGAVQVAAGYRRLGADAQQLIEKTCANAVPPPEAGREAVPT